MCACLTGAAAPALCFFYGLAADDVCCAAAVCVFYVFMMIFYKVSSKAFHQINISRYISILDSTFVYAAVAAVDVIVFYDDDTTTAPA